MNPGWLGVAALAQFEGQARPPPRLPRPPLLEHALLENPLPLALGLAALAFVAAYVLNRRGRLRLGVIAAACLFFLAAGVVALARTVQTDREVVRERTLALVDAVARIDEGAMRALLAEDARLFAGARPDEVTVPATGLQREQIIARVEATLGGPYRITEHRAAELEAAMTGANAARSQLRVRVVVEGWNLANNSYWRLEWRRDPDGVWRAWSITPWSIDGLGDVSNRSP